MVALYAPSLTNTSNMLLSKTPSSVHEPSGRATIDVESLDAALKALEAVSPEHATIVELRFSLGLTVEETAEALGIAETTVKTHLGRLYTKTGARRHADLVKLIAEFSNPLVA